jgi:FkbM family methyltransferase
LTSAFAVRLRSITRKLGINSLLGALMAGRGYEDRFGRAFQSEIRPGDVVWDIGANVGLYTTRFASAVGEEGRVMAFEPTPACFRRLSERCSGHPRILLKNSALGASDGTVQMEIETDELAATHRVIIGEPDGARLATVAIRSAASLVRDEPTLFPNLVKIDVEGHEGAVMAGFKSLLPDPRLRCFGIEVHFGLLEARGESDCPRAMKAVLERHGFRVQWTDPSHLIAIR